MSRYVAYKVTVTRLGLLRRASTWQVTVSNVDYLADQILRQCTRRRHWVRYQVIDLDHETRTGEIRDGAKLIATVVYEVTDTPDGAA